MTRRNSRWDNCWISRVLKMEMYLRRPKPERNLLGRLFGHDRRAFFCMVKAV
jgi:hypothetical protein